MSRINLTISAKEVKRLNEFTLVKYGVVLKYIVSDLINLVIPKVNYTISKRKTLEKRIIFKLGTLYPTGLNKKCTYLQ